MKAEVIMIEGISMTVLSVEGHQEINQHSRLTVKGYMEESEIDKVMRIAAMDGEIVVIAKAQGETQTLFKGLIYSADQKKKEGVYYLTLDLISETIRLEGVEKTRTYQNGSLTFGELIKSAGSEEKQMIYIAAQDMPIKKFVAQYKETNWDFIMRMASNLNACVVPQVQGRGISCSVGLIKDGKESTIKDVSVAEKNEVHMVRQKKSKGLFIHGQDGVSYEFSDTEIYGLGDKVIINGKLLYIAQIDTYYKEDELWHAYEAKSEKSLQAATFQNLKLTGASLMGSVANVVGARVAVRLEVDANNPLCGSRMFPFSTVYSSPDGTGWYCMPENGDTIRVYFPTEFEKDAYVISSVHVEAPEEQNIRTNPQIKSISNAYGKEIILSPSGITITNNDGMSITLDDNYGMSIESDLPIYISSDDTVQIGATQSVYINAKSELKIEQGEGNYLDMKDETVTLTSEEFRLQEKK